MAPPGASLQPVFTSSKIRSAPFSWHISRNASKKPGSASMQPQSIITGSQMTAAICPGRSLNSDFTDSRLLNTATSVRA